jgi:hypothetical protein
VALVTKQCLYYLARRKYKMRLARIWRWKKSAFFETQKYWHSGLRVRLRNRKSRVQISARVKDVT